MKTLLNFHAPFYVMNWTVLKNTVPNKDHTRYFVCFYMKKKMMWVKSEMTQIGYLDIYYFRLDPYGWFFSHFTSKTSSHWKSFAAMMNGGDQVK